jgi:iron(III) transport system substrate-binding protein
MRRDFITYKLVLASRSFVAIEEEKMRKRFGGAIFISIWLISGQSAFAQDSKLIAEAKKEGGKVVVYSSMETSIAESVGNAFKNKTGIEMEFWRASSTKVMDRALNEHRAGRPLADVVVTIADPMLIMQREGVFAKYDSPAAAAYPKELIDPNLGPSYRNLLIGIVYNKNVIRPGDAPASLEDLVKPQYKGKLVMPDPTQHTTTTQWLASLHKLMGKEKAEKYIRDLAATKPTLVESLLPPVERAATGEIPIAITLVHYTYVFGQTGAPLDYVRLPKMLGDGNYIALNNKAPRPNAGKLFIDYFLDDESMKIMAKLGEFVNRKGIYPPLPDADKIQFIPMDKFDTKAYAEKKKEFQRIFLRSTGSGHRFRKSADRYRKRKKQTGMVMRVARIEDAELLTESNRTILRTS